MNTPDTTSHQEDDQERDFGWVDEPVFKQTAEFGPGSLDKLEALSQPAPYLTKDFEAITTEEITEFRHSLGQGLDELLRTLPDVPHDDQRPRPAALRMVKGYIEEAAAQTQDDPAIDTNDKTENFNQVRRAQNNMYAARTVLRLYFAPPE